MAEKGNTMPSTNDTSSMNTRNAPTVTPETARALDGDATRALDERSALIDALRDEGRLVICHVGATPTTNPPR